MTFKFHIHKHPPHALHDAKWDFCHYYQTGQTTNPQYLEDFNNKALVIESYGVSIGTDPGMAKEDLAGALNTSDSEKQSMAKSAKIKYLGFMMLCGAD